MRKDLDGFFGLMIDNLIELILIVSLCRELIHLPDPYIFGKILPGAAIWVLVGNLLYAWQAHQLACAGLRCRRLISVRPEDTRDRSFEVG